MTPEPEKERDRDAVVRVIVGVVKLVLAALVIWCLYGIRAELRSGNEANPVWRARNMDMGHAMSLTNSR
jgi:hypothetical protein